MKVTLFLAALVSAALLTGLAAAQLHSAPTDPDTVSGPDTIPAEITGEVILEGALVLEGDVMVNGGAVLTILAGSVVRPRPGSGMTVQGQLRIQGEKGRPVVIVPSEGVQWKGITFLSGAEGTVTWVEIGGAGTALSLIASRLSIDDAFVSGSKTAIHLVREASAQITDCQLKDNQIGVAVDMKSVGRVSGCLFEGNEVGLGIASGGVPEISGNRFVGNSLGIQVHQRYPGKIEGNLFRENKAGIRLYQNGPDTIVEKNRFVDNQDASVLALSYTSPTIRNNFMSGGKYGIFVNQFSSPRILDNRIEKMEEAVHLNKKNASEFVGNVVADSKVGLFCDFSSYPRIRDNLFAGNDLHIKLGKFQSSNWEGRAGSKRLVMQAATRAGSRNPRLAEGPEEFPEAVDATGNWWDKKTLREMKNKGEAVEISTLYDGHDLDKVTYEGFGDESYTLDKVLYWPALEKEPVTAGLKGWKGNSGELGF
ncbi:MAG: right-handed parallel beta-helix repeat-containing protein [bacterium]|nr:right-handed parallel beta-helix repeat-containing protein [bacterium]